MMCSMQSDLDPVLVCFSPCARKEPQCPPSDSGNRLTLAPRKKASLLRLALMMVEARGFEPLSEDNATQASTGVVTVLMSPERRPVTDYALGQPDYLLPSTPGGDRTAYPTTC